MKWCLMGFYFLIFNTSSALELVVPIDELPNYFPDYKCPLKWEDGFFDPLRIDLIRTQVKETINDEETGYIIWTRCA